MLGYAMGQDWTDSWGACKCTQLETSWVSHPSAKSLDCSLPGSSVHRILRERILQWDGMPFSRGPSWPRNQTRVSYISCIGKWFCITSATWEAVIPFSSDQFSRSVMSNSLQPHEPQHTRLPCPSPTPGVYPNSCPLSPWCHPTISSSVIPFSSCPQSFPASGLFQMSQISWPKYWSSSSASVFQWTPRTDLF